MKDKKLIFGGSWKTPSFRGGGFTKNQYIEEVLPKKGDLARKGGFTSMHTVLSPIKMKFFQMIVCCMTKISNILLAQCWRQVTSPRLFYDFIKMAI